ncbi:MAG: type III pantothenate kinase [Oscillospiraceae bacterium]|nr:type III pantothenate kinase [Oscillospiraceae bacterium]
MILALDVGNTNITVGCITDGDAAPCVCADEVIETEQARLNPPVCSDITHVFRISTNIARTADEYAIQINNMLQFQGIKRNSIVGAVISSVVPPLTSTFKNAVRQLAGVEPIIVGAGVKTGLNILIDDPAQLGGDMVATAVGAIAKKSLPAIVVDFGTATKMFVINQNGSFIGGAILPGVALSMNALAAGTSQLPRIPIEAPLKSISTNTIDCIKSGVIFGAASAIDGMVERYEAELGQQALVIATGGLAESVYKHCKHEIVYDPHLILHGLSLIYEKNKRK